MPAQLPSDYAVAVRDERARRGWTQTHVAERAGITRQLVARIESSPGGVSFERVLRVLAVLDIVPVLGTPADSAETEGGRDLAATLDEARARASSQRQNAFTRFGPGHVPVPLSQPSAERARRSVDAARPATDADADRDR